MALNCQETTSFSVIFLFRYVFRPVLLTKCFYTFRNDYWIPDVVVGEYLHYCISQLVFEKTCIKMAKTYKRI